MEDELELISISSAKFDDFLKKTQRKLKIKSINDINLLNRNKVK
jgi:hypothetical protein